MPGLSYFLARRRLCHILSRSKSRCVIRHQIPVRGCATLFETEVEGILVEQFLPPHPQSLLFLELFGEIDDPGIGIAFAPIDQDFLHRQITRRG